MTDIRTVAIVGVGRAGLQHARAAKLNGLHVVAHASKTRNSERSCAFSQEIPESKPYSFDDLTICDCADLVILAVPPTVTDDVASTFIRASQRILIEKPAALTTSRLRELLQAEKESRCDVVVGYNRRSYPLVSHLRNLLHDDTPTHVDVTVVEDMEYIRGAKSADLHSSYLRHGSATHFLDLVQFLFGELSLYEIQTQQSPLDKDFVNHSFRAVSTSGVSIRVSIDAGDRARRGLEISTSRGRCVHLAPLERMSITRNGPTRDCDSPESREILDWPSSYPESFAIQLRKIITGDVDTLHRLDDSLKLSMVFDKLELASNKICNE
jgi:predicted dehydrogenase